MDRGTLISLTVTIALTVATVAIHYRVLRFVSGRMECMDLRIGRRIAVMFLGIFTAHYVEIILYAAGYSLLQGRYGLGRLEGSFAGGFDGFVYFSAVAYTSLGLGDIAPTGALRLLAGFETLTGLLMIAWSASFTFIYMQKYWKT
jgi:hypothetical protein